MQGERRYNIILLLSSFVLLGFWLFSSLSAGISGDEYVHQKHAEDVVEYYATWGKNTSALETPVTNLKYYGQSYDNAATLIARLFNIEDIFTLRHIMSVIAAWLIIFLSYKLGHHLGGKWAGLLTALFLLFSPRFIGHSFNNLKDIPFALSYLMSVYSMIRWIPQVPNPKLKESLMLILSIAFAISIRPAGILMICYLVLFSGLWYVVYGRLNSVSPFSVLKSLSFIIVCAYLLGLLFWPYALENPFWHPLESHFIMSNYPVTMRQLFEGKLYWSDQLPWYYIFKYIAITAPISVVYLFLFSPLLFNKGIGKAISTDSILVLFFVCLFPLMFIVFKASNLYGGARHLLFIIPIICVLAALFFVGLLRAGGKVFPGIIFSVLVLIGFIQPIKYIIKDHPYQYTFFNLTVGGLEKAYGAYETDYYYTSLRQGADELWKHIRQSKEDTIVVASNFRIEPFVSIYDKAVKTIYTPYYQRGNVDWDYGLFVPAHLYPHNSASLHWPPRDGIMQISIDEKALCVGVKRNSKLDHLAFEALGKKQYQDAIQLSNQFTTDKPFSLSANMSMGEAYFNMGQFDQAQKVFNTCLYILPNYEPAQLHLALIAKSNNQIEKAIDLLKEIISFNPKYTKAHSELVYIYRELNKLNLAKEVIKEGLKNKPFDKTLLSLLEAIKNDK